MKTLISNELINKLTLYKDNLIFLNNLNSFINSIQNGDTSVLLKSKLVEKNIYVYKLHGMRVFFSIQVDNDGNEVFALLDFVHRDNLTNKIVTMNPIYNHNINPVYNHNINPVYNHNINPVYNHNINPVYNHNINPVYNKNINPVYNHNINPVYNKNINPVYNHNINPVYNKDINPIYNPSFNGYHVYSLDMQSNEYIIDANESIKLFYDKKSKFVKYATENNDKGYVIFDTNNHWVQYMIPDSDGGFVLFNKDGRWMGTIK
ncbi:MAG: hypothetical protein WD469_12735 [Paenibacillaceae bacterium]